MLYISFREINRHIRDIALCVTNGSIDGVHETFVWREVEFLVTGKNLFVEILVDLHGVFLDHLFRGSVVAFGSDALNLSQQFSIQTTKTLIVVHAQVVLAVFFDDLHFRILRRHMRQYPVSNQLTVAHVRFLHILTRLNTNQLRHCAIHHLLIISGLKRLFIRQQAQFYQLRIRQIIQAEQVRTGLFYRRSMLFERILADTRHQFTATVSNTFVQVGM